MTLEDIILAVCIASREPVELVIHDMIQEYRIKEYHVTRITVERVVQRNDVAITPRHTNRVSKWH